VNTQLRVTPVIDRADEYRVFVCVLVRFVDENENENGVWVN